ncbi:hypothetical protein ZIOFF_042251 [Zingiber officinale]|uniref:dUTP diphosphatase n=1 Tax=Zingiber officinale TaxID=94328 RepID=A0A8J5KZS7_ZINOF|nr:hypothetical protein ZIOFF_042251 [Zingiber officinale]
MSYINTKATSSYKEALQATEEIEAPTLGFCRPSEYKGGISSNIALIKQANTQIQLLTTILEKLEALEERIKKLEAKETPQQQPLPEAGFHRSFSDPKGRASKDKKVMALRNQDPPVTAITRTEGAPLFEDQVREYHQNQRRRYNARRAVQRVTIRIIGGTYNNSLEQQLDPQVQLRLSMQERAAIVPAEVLYHSRRDDVHHRVYVHRSEEAMLVTGNQVDRAFIQPESYTQLQRSGMRFLHMGVIQVRVQILHRQEEGTLALIVFRDNRWQGDQGIFATMEIDLTHGSQLVYVIPDTMLTISDFYRNIQVSILTRGYENWRNGEANLLVTRGLVGRLSNTPNVGFAYEVQNVVDYLASHGVRALPGRSYSTRDVLGQNWIIRQSTVSIPMQPTEVNTRNMLDGSVSLQFDSYQAATSVAPPKFNSRDEEVQSDEEEITGHIVSVLIEERNPEEELLVKRVSSLAQMPERRTPGATGYDISITHAQDIPAGGRSLLSTGICIQIPQNTYARIAPRSSTALQDIIIMGGVIDSDYRGEVKIMAFNITNEDIFLRKQEFIAQLIFERISTPSVREVEVLGSTARGMLGFGSTTKQVCSSNKANPNCNGCHYCCSDEDYVAEYVEYVAARPKPNECNQQLKQKEVISPLAIKPFPEEKLLAMQKEARQYAMEQHKFYEEEAYLNLLDENPSMERTHFEETMEQLEDKPHLQASQHLAGLMNYWTSMRSLLKESGQALTPHMKKTELMARLDDSSSDAKLMSERFSRRRTRGTELTAGAVITLKTWTSNRHTEVELRRRQIPTAWHQPLQLLHPPSHPRRRGRFDSATDTAALSSLLSLSPRSLLQPPPVQSWEQTEIPAGASDSIPFRADSVNVICGGLSKVQNLLVQMQNRFQAMSEGILLKNILNFVPLFDFNTLDDMGSKIDELEQSINDLKAEIGVEDAAKPKPQEDKLSHDAA